MPGLNKNRPRAAEASGSQSNAPEAMNVGSMIISTLVSDLSCEHVGRFVFVDEHDRSETLTQEQEALMREYDSEEALMRELGSGLEVPTQEHDDSEALMKELGSGLEVPMQEHCSNEALMRELGSGLEVPTQEHDMKEVLTRELGGGLEALRFRRENINLVWMLGFHMKHGFAV